MTASECTIEELYDEAIALAKTLRQFVERRKEPVSGRPPGRSGLEAQAMSGLTRHLLEIVAWAAVNKAVTAGELAADEVDWSKYAISAWDAKLDAEDTIASLQDDFATILVAVRDLHGRALAMTG